MTASRPGVGMVAELEPAVVEAIEPDGRRWPDPHAATESGGWRSDAPFNHEDGLKVTIKREPGMTPSGLLVVPFRFQAPPIDSFGRTWTYDWPTNQTLHAGEQPNPGGPQLRRPSFQTMFLDQEHDWMVWTDSLDVQRLVKELRLLLARPAVFRLTVGQPALWGPEPLLTMTAAFTSLEFEQRGGEVGTEYSQVEFIEVPRQRLEQRARQRPAHSDTERRHTLRHGESLYDVALAAYKRKSAWTTIRDANGIARVPPDDADALARWAKDHNRKTLRVPARPDTAKGGG